MEPFIYDDVPSRYDHLLTSLVVPKVDRKARSGPGERTSWCDVIYSPVKIVFDYQKLPGCCQVERDGSDRKTNINRRKHSRACTEVAPTVVAAFVQTSCSRISEEEVVPLRTANPRVDGAGGRIGLGPNESLRRS